MITAIRSNKPSFKEVRLEQGFNIVLADRTKESTKMDSRNGLGKTTLIEIIHFCLGSNTSRGKGLMVDTLKGWSFTLDLLIDGRELSVTRNTTNPRWFHLGGNVNGLDIPNRNRRLHGMYTLDTKSWNSVLGRLFFDLSGQELEYAYHPTFRNLISYFVRHGRESFVSPFAHIMRQSEKFRQVSNAFLLGLSWEQSSQLNELKDEQGALNRLRQAARRGLLEGAVGSIGNLEAERARLDLMRREQAERLDSFRVHPNYRDIEEEVNELTSSCHKLVNTNQSDGRLLNLYHQAIEVEQEPDTDEVLRIYQEVGAVMPNLVAHRLEEVREFHLQIVDNRREYLQAEIQRIERARQQRELQISEAVERRARLLSVLATHGALQEHTRLQELHLDVVNRLREIDSNIANLQRFEQGQSDVKVRRELFLQEVRQEFAERQSVRERAITFFNSNSQALYSAPGNLILDVTAAGFRFDVEILRSGSQGIDNMKIFCFDLTLAQLWATRRPAAGLLIHDSTIFDGVDERQVAQALELAKRESERLGFQYVCALNSDTLPTDDLSEGFDLDSFVRLRLADESEEGGLLGIRY